MGVVATYPAQASTEVRFDPEHPSGQCFWGRLKGDPEHPSQGLLGEALSPIKLMDGTAGSKACSYYSVSSCSTSDSGTYCTKCSAGSYDSEKEGECVSCTGPVQYQDEDGQASCKSCPAGVKSCSAYGVWSVVNFRFRPYILRGRYQSYSTDLSVMLTLGLSTGPSVCFEYCRFCNQASSLGLAIL